MNSEKTTPQGRIFRALIKQIKPIQAMVFMRVYDQFPERYIPNNDHYFRVRECDILKALKLKECVFYLMMTKLVENGFLERRKARSGGFEYRINFKAIEPFVEEE